MIHILDRLTSDLQKYLGKSARDYSSDLNKSSEETHLIDVQRRISIYLQALWGCNFFIKPAEGGLKNRERRQPYIRNSFIYLPDVFYDFTPDGTTRVTGLETYRAASTHAAAHIIYSKQHLSRQLVDNWQCAVIGVIEDARIETLSIREFPGLKPIWTRLHTATPLQNQTAGDYLDRLARALLDENYQDDDPWICRSRSLFNDSDDFKSDNFSWNIGLSIAHSFQKRKIKFNSRSDKQSAPYRDDNRHLWEIAGMDDVESPIDIAKLKLLSTNNSVVGSEEDKEQPTTHRIINEASVSETFIYSEWDYRSQTSTPFWVTLRERNPKSGDLKVINDITAENKHLISRMRNLLLAIKYKGVRRIRKQEEGDDIDVNAAVNAMIDFRLGKLPDNRIMTSLLRKTRDISVLVLLDLSSSANQQIQGQDHTVLQLTQKVCVLFADAIETVGDPLAIHGFNSRGRHDVDYFRFKDFNQPYDDVPKAKIAGMFGDRATRMGAAIRHATYHLNEQKTNKKLLMIITDGAPMDFDMTDRQYLRYDAKHAVIEAQQIGIHAYCIGLDPKADEYVSRIFGARNYMVVDHVRFLPEKMLLIYAALTL
jgi:nitric oxide reductase NorD protein